VVIFARGFFFHLITQLINGVVVKICLDCQYHNERQYCYDTTIRKVGLIKLFMGFQSIWLGSCEGHVNIMVTLGQNM
jgi:hypothetical protein